MIWRDRKLNLVSMASSPQHLCCSSTLPHPLLSYPCIYPFPYPFHADIFLSLSYLTSSCPLVNPHAYMTRTTFKSGNYLHTHAYTHHHWNKPPYSFHQLISISIHAWLFETPQIHPPTLMRTCKSGHLSRTHIPAPSYFSRHLTFSLYTTIIPANAHHHYIPIYISITYSPHLLMSHVHSFPSSLSSYPPYRKFITINLTHIVPSTSRFPHDIGHCLTRRHCLLRGF